jgi:hypothetical protein
MPRPRLVFFCELESDSLLEILETPGVISDLLDLRAGLSLAMIDFSPDRARAVQVLNQVGIPVNAWLVVEKQQGYYFNLDNYPAASARYIEFQQWTAENLLKWEAVGLDIEPDIRLLKQIASQRWRAIPQLMVKGIANILNRKRYRLALSAYRKLVKQIKLDGYPVESYQLPILADERKVRSDLLQRLTGIVDLQVNREVWMLYSSFLKDWGVGYLWSYAPQAQAIGIGITDGGVDSSDLKFKSLSWQELARDLRLAWYWTNDLYIFSLEGCVWQGYLAKLKEFAWDQPILFPEESAARVSAGRNTLQGLLWISKNFLAILAGLLGLYFFIDLLRRHLRDHR